MIKNYKPMQVVTACSLDMYAFPFDTQNCSLTFSSALHPGELNYHHIGESRLILCTLKPEG